MFGPVVQFVSEFNPDVYGWVGGSVLDGADPVCEQVLAERHWFRNAESMHASICPVEQSPEGDIGE